MVDLRLDQAAPFAQAMGTGFYADLEMMRDAIRQRSSFNLVHLDSLFKVDLFVARERDFDRAQLARRQLHLLSEEPERRVYVARSFLLIPLIRLSTSVVPRTRPPAGNPRSVRTVALPTPKTPRQVWDSGLPNLLGALSSLVVYQGTS